MLNAETMKRMIESEYKSTMDFATKLREAKLAAVDLLADIPPKAAVDGPERANSTKKTRTKSKLAESIKRWVTNGSPKEFTANDCADAIGADRDRTSIVMHGLSRSSTSGVRIVRREYAPRRNIYGKAK